MIIRQAVLPTDHSTNVPPNKLVRQVEGSKKRLSSDTHMYEMYILYIVDGMVGS